MSPTLQGQRDTDCNTNSNTNISGKSYNNRNNNCNMIDNNDNTLCCNIDLLAHIELAERRLPGTLDGFDSLSLNKNDWLNNQI